MPPKKPGVTATEPKNVFLKPLKFDIKSLFKGLAKGISHAAIGKWEELATDTLETLSAIGLATDPQELAFLLIRRSAIKAMFDLAAENANTLETATKSNPADLTSQLQTYISQDEFAIDQQFLNRPAELPLVAELQKLLGFWLEGLGVPTSSAAAITDRFPTYFVYALNEEWRSNAKSYAPLAEALDTPFAKAANRESAWLAYEALLQKRTQESVFDEPFSLAQIFIPLNAYYFDQTARNSARDEITRHEQRPRVVVRLQEELERWVQHCEREDALRIVSGGPGSGKSSFARMFAAHLAVQHKRVLFIPLHLIDATKDLIGEVGRFVQDEGVLVENPLDSNSAEPDLTLIFDGLDELASQGKAAAETARAFIREIEKTLARRNMQSVKLRALISGREVVIQENEWEFRRNRQVLFLLPYFLPEAGDRQEKYNDAENVLATDLRRQWWQVYGRLTGGNFPDLPEQFARKDLDEITGQPLLNYLLALSFTRGKVDFGKNVNLNVIYEDLVAAIYERGYEKRRRYIPIHPMTLDNFSRVLEEIGLAAWHGDGRTTTVREIEEHCDASGVGKLLEVFQEGAQAGITRLLAAFFFRRHGARDSGDPTFVFTHKSFGEYLTARRLVRGVEKIVRELAKREQDPDEGWDEKEALKRWVHLSGPTAMTQYLRSFVRSEIELRDPEQMSDWQESLARLLNHVLRHGMPIEQTQITPFQRAMFQSRNAEEALLVVLNVCALATEKVSQIRPPDRTSFGAWFKRIQGQRSTAEVSLPAASLSYLDLSGAVIEAGDFLLSNLAGAKLMGVNASFAVLAGADFTGANLARSDLAYANLTGANLAFANLTNADLAYADLTDANLVYANLTGANLTGANLTGANLKGTIYEDRLPPGATIDPPEQ